MIDKLLKKLGLVKKQEIGHKVNLGKKFIRHAIEGIGCCGYSEKLILIIYNN